jgi:hypothetical protein
MEIEIHSYNYTMYDPATTGTVQNRSHTSKDGKYNTSRNRKINTTLTMCPIVINIHRTRKETRLESVLFCFT